MTPELIAIVMVGIALAGVILASTRGVRQDMAGVRQDMTRLESRLDGRIAALESRLDGKIAALSAQLGELRERMAHLEGVLDGLREAIALRAKAS